MASSLRFPLAARIALAVVLGVALGWLVGPQIAPIGEAGMVVIKLLKMLAAPLLFFAVIDAFVRAEIPARLGGRLLAIAALNASVAVVIGLAVAHVFAAGEHWRGHLEELLGNVHGGLPHAPTAVAVPNTIVDVFSQPSLIPLVALAAAVGLAMRRLRGDESVAALARAAHAGYLISAKLLAWLVWLVPFAIALVLASVIAQNGLSVFVALGGFVATITLGLLLQALGYYPLLLTLGGHSPRRFFAAAIDPMATALSCGSSLATLPVTLSALDKMGVPERSSRLSACVGTNLNHDGIILYEAAAALFVAQALGWHLSLGQELQVALSAVLAGIGISGVPEAGLVTLPLVLSAAGVDEATVITLVPILFSVDWFIGRMRAATNVMSDMVVANLLN